MVSRLPTAPAIALGFSSQNSLWVQVSDAILDACLEQDPDSKVACETATKTNMVCGGVGVSKQCVLAGELPLELCALGRQQRLRWPHWRGCPVVQVMVFGEITTRAKVDYEKIVRDTCREIGFTSDDVGLDADKCKVGTGCHLTVCTLCAPVAGGPPPSTVPPLTGALCCY